MAQRVTSKRIKPPKPEIPKIYCRKCQETLRHTSFYSAVNPILDSNGYMSICKNCIDELYENLYKKYKDIGKSIHATCQILDLAYIPDAVSATITTLTKKEGQKPMGVYKRILGLAQYSDIALTYREPENKMLKSAIDGVNSVDDDILNVWGLGFTVDEYKFLEGQMAKYTNSQEVDNQAEHALYREICFTELRLKNARVEGNTVTIGKELKVLQELFKTAAIDPAKAKAVSASKNTDTFGNWIKDIEELTPAEWLGKKGNEFEDMDGLRAYFEDYLVRPIKNFFTGTRDFHVSGGDEDDVYDSGDGE